MKYFLFIIALLSFFRCPLLAQWTSDSSKNTQVSPFGTIPLVTSDGDDGAIVFFWAGYTKAYVQRIDKNGYVKWNNGIPVRVGGYLKNQTPKAICSDGLGGAYLLYEETDKNIPPDTGRILVFTNRVDSNGKLLWNDSIGIDLNHDLYNPSPPYRTKDYDKVLYKIVSSQKNGYYYAWVDSTQPTGENNKKLKFQRIIPDGSKAFGEYGFAITNDVPFDAVSDIVDDNKGGVFVSTAYRIYHFDSTGVRLSPDSGIYISQSIRYIKLINSNDNVFICSSYEYINLSGKVNYYLTAIDSSNNILWDKKILDSTDIIPKASFQNNGAINLFWRKKFSDSDYCIYYLRVNNSGGTVFDSAKRIITDSISIGEPEPFLSDSNSIILIWPKSGLHYYALKIDSSGEYLWNNSLLINANRTFDKINAITQSTKGIIVIWYEVAERYGIYAQNINSNGTLGPVTLIEKDFSRSTIPNNFQFVGNYPNPFNSGTTVVFDLPQKGNVKIAFYDIVGREILRKEENFDQGGRYSFPFNGTNLASGMYLCSIQYEGQIITKKIRLIK